MRWHAVSLYCIPGRRYFGWTVVRLLFSARNAKFVCCKNFTRRKDRITFHGLHDLCLSQETDPWSKRFLHGLDHVAQ